MLYNNPLEPSLQISVNTVNTTIDAVGAFNTLYFLAYPGPSSDLPSFKPELITSLSDYKRRIGGSVPTDYLGLVNYLSIAAAFKNLKGSGLIKVIAVRQPALQYSIEVTNVSAVVSATGLVAAYKLVINGVVISREINIPATASSTTSQFVTNAIAQDIRDNLELRNSVYVREVNNVIISLSPFLDGQPLSINTAFTGFGVQITQYTSSVTNTLPDSLDYLQALYLGLNEEDALGVIVAPGFYATSPSAEALLFTKQVDSFCRQAEYQQLFISDVVNPDLRRIAEYATLAVYNPLNDFGLNQLFEYNGSIYVGLIAGSGYQGSSTTSLAAVPAAANNVIYPSQTRVVLPSAVAINGITSNVVQVQSATAVILNINAPTALELASFITVSYQQLINEALFVNNIGLVETGSNSEQALYRFRDNFNSLEGHVSTVAPYQNYVGPELSLSTNFALPASVYQAALWIYVANTIGVFTPPASDDYPLEATKGPIWQVTRAGHALLNGKGINIIKTIDSAYYVMGARTQAQNDLYNRQNARLILSLYVRTLKFALKRGLVLKPLTSSGTFLTSLKARADRVSRAFFNAGLLDGASESEAFNNKCDSSLNPLSALQQGIIRLESKISQIGMSEKIVVTVQESLIGSLNDIL